MSHVFRMSLAEMYAAKSEPGTTAEVFNKIAGHDLSKPFKNSIYFHIYSITGFY